MRINTITGPDINNGLGNRITIWVSGCSHKCPGCHNPQTWDYNVGSDVSDTEKLIHILSLIQEYLKKDYIDGVTFSGGDPLDQTDESLNQLLALINAIKQDYPSKNIWIYSGDVYEHLIQNETKQKILNLCDVLVDGPFILDKKDTGLAFRGSSNQRIIDLQKSIKHNTVIEMEIP